MTKVVFVSLEALEDDELDQCLTGRNIELDQFFLLLSILPQQ